MNITELGSEIAKLQQQVDAQKSILELLFKEIKKVIVGQDDLIKKMLIGVLSDGHILIEGVPGLAKTLTVKTLSDTIDCHFKRIQFTPDLLPADLIGTEIFDLKSGNFAVKKGPIFTNIILADEINRAPAKVQSALLECMQEKQVTIGENTYQLDETFFVLATENPIEQEGTYPLPEAQVDRFMLKIKIDYPTKEEELQIVKTMSKKSQPQAGAILSKLDLLALQTLSEEIFIDDSILHYILNIVQATRSPENFGLDIKKYIEFGASPRASIYLTKAAKALALIEGRAHVIPEDIKAIAPDILRHRLIVSYEAEADDISSEMLIAQILEAVVVP